MDIKTDLSDVINIPNGYKLIDAGGTWQYQTNPEEWTILKKLLCFAIKSTKDIKTEVIVEFKKYANSYSSNYYVYLNDSLLHPDGISDSDRW